ncbi:hydrolase [Alloscardovia macacae]|uniref:CocE/NonD family hydrolase n=1 Tax=Alloscardovia macacae TaxID=1160091 RepID=UPI000A2E9541|nr:CocE/NonD family hydrolase [Alloscardovia macacae]OTA27602.1 hydrolase [Alloscardovia macacae]
MSDLDDFVARYVAGVRAQYDAAVNSPATLPAGEKTTHHLACSDGVQLTTDVWTPVTSHYGPVPTIVARCPYPIQEGLWDMHGEELTRRGYALVVQWCRGTHTSEGVWEPNVHERSDGADLLAWLEEQDWVGAVGLWGTSYLALTCWAVADIVTPKVKSICANHYGTDRFSSAYEKGAFRPDVLTGWAMQNAGKPVDADYLESAAYRPQMRVDEDLWGVHLDWYREWISHPQRDDPYWDEGFWGLLAGIPSRVRVPMLIHEGWFDHHLGSALTSYARLPEETKAHSWLKIGCWNHFFANPLEGLEPEHLDASELPAALEWFDLTLQQGKTPERRVDYYAIGEDTWHRAETWPPTKGTSESSWYLTEEDSLEASASEGQLHYTYDPEHPVPTHGGEALLTSMEEIGSKKQKEAGYRADVLSFTSETLTHDLRVQGAARLELEVSSSAEDSAFTATLLQVDTDGTARNYRSSIATLAHDAPYTPGEKRMLTLDFWDVCWTLPAGSRLRVDVSSSNFPAYSIHTNTAGLWSEQAHTVLAEQTVYTGASRVILPISCL